MFIPSRDAEMGSLDSFGEEEEERDIVVTGVLYPALVSLQDGLGGSAQFGSVSWDSTISIADRYLLSASNSTYKMLGTTLEGLGASIKAMVALLEGPLPDREVARLNALATTLDVMGKGLQLGSIDLESARSAVSTGLQECFDQLGGVGMGVLMGTLAKYASSIVPISPAVNAVFIVGSAGLGFAVSYAMEDVYAGLGDFLTNSLFSGVQSLANSLNSIAEAITNYINPLDGMLTNMALTPEEIFELDDLDHSWIDPSAYDAAPVTDYGRPVSGGPGGTGPYEPPMPELIVVPGPDLLPVVNEF